MFLKKKCGGCKLSKKILLKNHSYKLLHNQGDLGVSNVFFFIINNPSVGALGLGRHWPPIEMDSDRCHRDPGFSTWSSKWLKHVTPHTHSYSPPIIVHAVSFCPFKWLQIRQSHCCKIRAHFIGGEPSAEMVFLRASSSFYRRRYARPAAVPPSARNNWYVPRIRNSIRRLGKTAVGFFSYLHE